MQEASRLESFVDMLRRLREPHLIASRSGLVLAANVAAADALGTSVSALEGTSLESYSPAPARLRERLLGSPAEAPFPLRARDGRRFFCDASVLGPDLLLLRLSGGPETAPRARVFFETLARLRETAADDSAHQTLEELSRALLTHGMTAVGAMAGGVFLLDEAGANLELKGSVGYSDGNVDRFRLIPMSAPLPVADTVRHATPVLLGSTEEVTERYPALAQGHPDIVAGRAAACMPLVVEGRTIGAIALGFARERTFGEGDRGALRALAMQCAEVFDWAHRLEGGRTAAELENRAASRLERLHVFTRALAQAITPAQVTEAVVDMGITATSARNGGLWLTSPDGSVVCLARSVGPGGPRVAGLREHPAGRRAAHADLRGDPQRHRPCGSSRAARCRSSTRRRSARSRREASRRWRACRSSRRGAASADWPTTSRARTASSRTSARTCRSSRWHSRAGHRAIAALRGRERARGRPRKRASGTLATPIGGRTSSSRC